LAARFFYSAPARWSASSDYRCTEVDMPVLGWRHRRHYDMRATLITLAVADGADPHLIETPPGNPSSATARDGRGGRQR
jgi:hypothetical protein